MSGHTVTPEREQLVREISEALFHLVWRYRQQADQQLAPLGVNSLKALVLGMIEREKLHPKALAGALDLAPPAISHVLTELEEKGLIARSIDQRDRRRLVLELTAEGRRLLERIADSWNALNTINMVELTDEQATTFLHLLRKLTGPND